MSVHMKMYDIENEDDICQILLSNKIRQFNNAFELYLKNIKKSENFLNKNNGNLYFLLEATLIPLTIQDNNSSISLLRENSNEYIVHFVNIKNESGEYIGSLIDNLSANDRILFINGIILKNNCKFYDSPRLIIEVRPEKPSSVIILKCKSSSLSKSSFPIEKNLSQLTAPGCYSLFGNVINTMKYTDEDLMLLRIQCFDKSCIKIYKYPRSVIEFKNILMAEKNNDVKYDFSSNSVDILVKKPCNSFISLVPNQRVLLNNVKVKYSNTFELFFLHLKGNMNNIKADTIETIRVNSIRPPMKHFLIPNELKPKTKQRTKQICNNGQSIDNSKKQKSISFISPIKTLSEINNSSKEDSIQLSDVSSDDNVNISPCRVDDFSTLKHVNRKEKKNDVNSFFCRKSDNIISSTFVTNHNCEVGSRVPDYSSNSPKKYKSFSMKRKMHAQKDNSPNLSPLFFEAPTELNPKEQSKTLHSSNINTDRSRTCIGPCRLVYFEPSLLDDNSIVCGYCKKCHVFIQESFIKSSNMEHRCPNCLNIVHLTFFFKMIFLYGKNYNQAIEVCCYNENATKVLKKLTKEIILLESYLSNQYYRKLVVDSIKSFIINQTKLNIIVKESTDDKTFILLGVDTKYVITSPNH